MRLICKSTLTFNRLKSTRADNSNLAGNLGERISHNRDMLRILGVEVDKEVVIKLRGPARATNEKKKKKINTCEFHVSELSNGSKCGRQKSATWILGYLRLDPGERDVAVLESGKALVQAADLVGDGEVQSDADGAGRDGAGRAVDGGIAVLVDRQVVVEAVGVGVGLGAHDYFDRFGKDRSKEQLSKEEDKKKKKKEFFKK